MFEYHLFSNTDTLNSISERCHVKLSSNISIPGLKLDKDKLPISNIKFKKNVYLINFDYDEVRHNRLFDKTGGVISQLVRDFIRIVLNEYRPSSTLADVLYGNQQQVMLLGNVVSDNPKRGKFCFKIIAGAVYKMNPSYGVFVSFLHVDGGCRRKGLGRLMLWLLQHMSRIRFGRMRILVWITRSEINKKQTNQNNHILFYRRLGFCPSNPLHLPLEQMVPSELVQAMRDPIAGPDTLTVSTSCIEFVGECCQEISWHKPMIDKDVEKCCSCFMEGTNILVTCQIKACGLKMCVMCYSQFGAKLGSSRCVFHLTNTFMNPTAVKGKIKSYHELLQQNTGLNNNMVLRQRSHQECSEYSCQICKIINSSDCWKNSFKLPISKYLPNPSFTMYSENNPKLPQYDLKYFNHENDLKLATDLARNNRSLYKRKQCIIYIDKNPEGEQHIPKHPKMLLANLNSATSILQNGMFEICGSLAFGDCGYLSILNSIRSNPEISQQVLQVILKKFKTDYNKRKMNKEFNVDLLRNIIAEERYNQKIVDMLSETMKMLLTYDFDELDHPLLYKFDFCYDEKLKEAYDKFKKDTSSYKKKKTFLDLLTRSAESSKTQFKHDYFLSQADILFLPMATNYMVRALCIKQDEDTTIAVKTDVV